MKLLQSQIGGAGRLSPMGSLADSPPKDGRFAPHQTSEAVFRTRRGTTREEPSNFFEASLPPQRTQQSNKQEYLAATDASSVGRPGLAEQLNSDSKADQFFRTQGDFAPRATHALGTVAKERGALQGEAFE